MTEERENVRVILGKVGLDPHDRGVMILTRILQDAGMEAIFLGRFQTADGVVRAAIQEDADVIALSDHCGVMIEIARDVMEARKRHGAEDIPVVAGGFIPETDIPVLESMGVTGNFTFGATREEMIEHIRKVARERKRALAANE